MQPKSKIKILVTGVGGPAGINIARLLRERDDVVVTGCDVDSTAAGQFLVDTFLVAPFVRETEKYKSWMIEASKNVDIVIPTVDEELAVLATFASELTAFIPLSLQATLEIAADKLSAYQWALEHIPEYAPKFVSLSDWSPSWSDAEMLFIKPRHGRGGRGCRLLKPTELMYLKQHETDLSDFIVMEYLPGTEWTVDAYVAKNGEIVYLVPRERLGLSGGISIKGRTVKNEAVIEATKALIAQLDMAGPVCIQWKADAQGQPKFVEINPRLSGGLMITVTAGVDPAAAIVAETRGEVLTVQDWQEVTVVGHFEYKQLL